MPVVLLLAAGCNSNQPVVENQANNTQQTQNQQTTQPSSQNNTSDWKTYTNAKYGFSVQYPTGWEFKEQSSNQQDGFFITKGNSTLAILPNGEFDYGLPENNPTKSTQTIAGKTAQVRVWNTANGSKLAIYNFTTSIPNWTKCDTTLKNCNRLDLQASNTDDYNTLVSVISKFTFQK